MRARPADRRLKERLEKIKLYADVSSASRRILRAAKKRGHLVFEIIEPALGSRTRRFAAGSCAGDGRLRRNRWRLAGRPAKRGLKPLGHLRKILIRRRHRRRRWRCWRRRWRRGTCFANRGFGAS